MHHNVSANDMNEGKMEHVKFGKMELNICVSLSHSNILQRAHQWPYFCMEKYWVQEWAILPQSGMDYSVEVYRYGC